MGSDHSQALNCIRSLSTLELDPDPYPIYCWIRIKLKLNNLWHKTTGGIWYHVMKLALSLLQGWEPQVFFIRWLIWILLANVNSHLENEHLQPTPRAAVDVIKCIWEIKVPVHSTPLHGINHLVVNPWNPLTSSIQRIRFFQREATTKWTLTWKTYLFHLIMKLSSYLDTSMPNTLISSIVF